jgi:hypothetical protein
MDLNNTGYTDYVISHHGADLLDNYPGLDGWFFDNYFSFPLYDNYLQREHANMEPDYPNFAYDLYTPPQDVAHETIMKERHETIHGERAAHVQQ